MSDSLQPHGLHSPWNSPSQNTGVSSCSLLQGIFPTQGWNPGLPHCRQILYQLSHKGSPRILEWVDYSFSTESSQPRNRTRVSCIAEGFFTNWAIREDKSEVKKMYWVLQILKTTAENWGQMSHQGLVCSPFSLSERGLKRKGERKREAAVWSESDWHLLLFYLVELRRYLLKVKWVFVNSKSQVRGAAQSCL